MNKKYFSLLYTLGLSLFCFGDVLAAPSIINITTENDTFIISGNKFGKKATPEPIRFETAEAYTVGNALSDESNWWGDRGPAYSQEIVSNQYQRNSNSTKNIKAFINKNNIPITWRENVGFADTGKIFVSLWLRMDWGINGQDDAEKAYQLKLHNFSSSVADNGAAEGAVSSLFAWWFPGSPGYSREYNTSESGSIYLPTNSLSQSERWYNIVHIIDMGTAGNADGSFYGYISDGNSGYIANAGNGIGKNIIGSDEPLIDALKMFNYLDVNHVNDEDIDVTLYYDDIYIDNSWARVELGDSSNYENCSRREMQIPLDWSDTTITAKINKGSFSIYDKLYLFVTDSIGNISKGIEIQLAEDSRPSINSMQIIQ